MNKELSDKEILEIRKHQLSEIYIKEMNDYIDNYFNVSER